MQNIKAFHLVCFLFIVFPFTLSAQETIDSEKIYFQNEIIRKVSVGDGGVWVIKGADSTGVGKLEPDGRELDYTHTVNSAFPLVGIVGKYGDSAMIATKGNYLLLYDNGKVSRLDEENGIRGNIINDITGRPNYTRVATKWGALESFDDKRFSYLFTSDFVNSQTEIIKISKPDDHPASVSLTTNGRCFTIGETVYEIVIKTSSTLHKTYFELGESRNLNAFATNREGRSYYLTVFLGDQKGLRTRQWECKGPSSSFLQDTTVYSISKYKEKMLIGTEKGLFYCTDYYPRNAYKIPLNDDYEIYDIVTQEKEGKIWVATNKGLLQLKEENIYPPQECTVNSLEWAKSIGGILQESTSSSITDKNGNVFITGHFEGAVDFGDTVLTAQNNKDFYLAKYNPQGQLIWARSAFNSGQAGRMMTEEGGTLALDSKGNVYATLKIYHSYGENEDWEISFSPGITVPKQAVSGSYLVKFDKEGSAKWVKKLPSYAFQNFQMDTDYEDNLILSMELEENNPYNIGAGKGVLKFNPDFDLLWAKSFPGPLRFFKLNKNGEFYLFEKSYPNATVVNYDKFGNHKWGNNFEGNNGNQFISNIKDIGYDLQGNTFISGYYSTISYYNFFVAKLNAIGTLEWVKTGISGSDEIYLKVDSLGNSYLNFNYWETAKIENHTFRVEDGKKGALVAKYDYAGGFSWAYSIPGLFVTKNGMSITQNKDLYLSGTLTEDIKLNGELLMAKGGANLFLAKLSDTTSYFNRNLVRGKTFYDKNKNNKFDEGDKPVEGNIIVVEPGPAYARSDQNGNYYLFLDKGNYSIRQIIPEYKGKRITQTFPAQPYQIKLSENKTDTAGFDFAHDVQVSPHLSVDVSSSRFRRCFKNTTVIEYCNEGFAAAENVQIELEYPDYVIPVASSFPWSSKKGKKIIFDIGTLQAQQCKRITLTDSVMCGDESIRGLTQCIRARITPVPTTPLHPNWDGSDLVISAECKDNGFVRLNIQNNGNGDMADSAVFKIFLQEALSYTGKYKLKKGENMSLNVLANGKPLHLEAVLSPFHPQKKSVSVSIHGCDENGNPQLKHTFTNQFPQNDDQDHYEISCLEIIDSYDPNDKQVIPAGISARHYVEEGSLLEYTIRFQNTGTDTAYTVVITDLLDPNLDISSLNVGLSSHLVKWELSGEEQPIITWRFSNINLPDSTTNEKASHGFVKFKMRPKEEARFGTAIKNKAAIYFDYNSPIITNETLTTLGIPESPPAEKLTFQNCNVPVTLAQEEDIEVILCETSSLQLSRQAPEPGRGRWKVIKGQAKIVDPYSHNTTAEDIAYGENIFQWEVSYCDVLVRSIIKVKREALPAAPEINPLPVLCEDDPLPAITAVGDGIEWYSDPALTQLLGTGNFYQLKNLASEQIYVIQQNTLCKSQASVVALNVHPKPAPPVAPHSVEACLETEKDIRLTAEGNNLRWYAEQELKNLLGEGESFQPKEMASQTYFVTQSSDYCESDPAKVVLNTKTFDPSEAFFANVVTPNGDEWNQFFYVRPFKTEECLGNFITVKIYNRMGKLLFQSTKRSFQWDATKVKAGIYFYSMEYDLKKFNGYVQVIR